MTAVRTRPASDPLVDLTDGVPLLDLTDPAGPGPAPAPSRAPEADEAPARGASRLRRLWFVPAGVALIGAAALVPAVGEGGPGPGEARLDVSGTAVVTEADGDVRTVRDARADVGPGDRVEVTEGTARFEMADGVRLEGRSGGAHGGHRGTTVTMAVAPRLVAGRLLAVAPRPVELRAGDARVVVGPDARGDGVARLDQRSGLGVGTYAGDVVVESAGRRAAVPALRRLDVAAPGAVGDDPLPLRYRADDPWDRRHLADALAVDAQLGPLLAGAGDRLDAFRDPAALAGAVDAPRGLAARVRAVDLGADALVLAAIATAADADAPAPVWDAAADFHAEGAPWGLVALDRGARSERVLATVRDALDTLDLDPAGSGPGGATDADRAQAGRDAGAASAAASGADPSADTAGAGASDEASAGGDAGGGSSPTGPGGETGPGGDGGGGGSTPAVPTAPTVPGVPSPTLPPSGPVGGAVGGVVDDLTGALDTIVPGAGGAVGGVVDDLTGAVGGLGGTVGDVGSGLGGPLGDTVGAVGDLLGGLGTGITGR